MGERVGPKGVPPYADAPHCTAAGIPAVLCRADERLLLDDHHKAKEAVALTLIDLPSAG